MQILSNKEIEKITECGKILANAMNKTILAVKPGVNALYLNNLAEKELRRNGARPSFLNYGSHGNKPFPASLCVSVNEEIVHGIPNKDKVIHQGDLVGLDLGAEYGGVCTDMAVTVIAGKARSECDQKLVNTAREALNIGIKKAIANNTTGDIGYDIQKYVESKGFSVIRDLVGHGIGYEPHQDPQLPNYGDKGSGERLKENTAIALEPMISAGKHLVRTKNDGWTVEISDGSFGAHFEHTLLIGKDKPKILTELNA